MRVMILKRMVLGTEKVPKRTCVKKILPNFRVNVLMQFASKPLFFWGSASRIVQKILWYFSCDFSFGVLFLALIYVFQMSQGTTPSAINRSLSHRCVSLIAAKEGGMSQVNAALSRVSGYMGHRKYTATNRD